jgi:hemoglobin-like flavoprotein
MTVMAAVGSAAVTAGAVAAPVSGERRAASGAGDSAPLSARDVALVQASFERVLPIADEAAALFYARLFELDPGLRALFRNDLAAQGRALMGMLRVAVAGLSRLDQIVPAVQALGRRHAAYGVTDAHYATVASALLWALERGLGDAFTPETRSAWVTVYTLLATAMQQATAAYRQPELIAPVAA